MKAQPLHFHERASKALKDENLQSALGLLNDGWINRRRSAVSALPEFEILRDQATRIKNDVLANLDNYLERYEAKVKESGGQVHWAGTAAEAREIVLKICRDCNARTVTKGKSMVAEEIGLNEALEEEGLRVIETDLGEYIVQLAEEMPSHIVFPAIHKTKAQIVELFESHHSESQFTGPRETVADLVDEARAVLRKEFFKADVGITGANYLVAETGSSVICTNEGNGDLTSNLARVHIVTVGIERVVPSLDDVSVFTRLLARSATGQEITTYTTFSTGPRRQHDLDGPEAYHVVLIDNGRSKILAGEFNEMLKCIRCGACMNHCTVYGAIGGHAYGWVYPGPMGAVLTSLHQGIEGNGDLANACTLNGRCQEVCPVKIPLPSLLKKLRNMQFDAGDIGVRLRVILVLWAFVVKRPTLYRLMLRWPIRILHRLGRQRGSFRHLPFVGAWTRSKDFPAPQEETFFDLWNASKRGRKE